MRHFKSSLGAARHSLLWGLCVPFCELWNLTLCGQRDHGRKSIWGPHAHFTEHGIYQGMRVNGSTVVYCWPTSCLLSLPRLQSIAASYESLKRSVLSTQYSIESNWIKLNFSQHYYSHSVTLRVLKALSLSVNQITWRTQRYWAVCSPLCNDTTSKTQINIIYSSSFVEWNREQKVKKYRNTGSNEEL